MKKIISLISFKNRLVITFVLMFLVFNNNNIYAQPGTQHITTTTAYGVGTTTTFIGKTHIIIDAGVQVTLSGTWKLDAGCLVTVSNQAFLYIKGGTITINSATPKTYAGYWEGIEVLSDVQQTFGHTIGLEKILLKTANYFATHWSSAANGSILIEDNSGTRSTIEFSKSGCVSAIIDPNFWDGIKQVVNLGAHYSGGYMYANHCDFNNNIKNSFGVGPQNFNVGYGSMYVENCSLRWTATFPTTASLPQNIKVQPLAFVNVHNCTYNSSGANPNGIGIVHSVSNVYHSTRNFYFAIRAWDIVFSRYDEINTDNGIHIQTPYVNTYSGTEIHHDNFIGVNRRGIDLGSIFWPNIYNNYFEDRQLALVINHCAMGAYFSNEITKINQPNIGRVGIFSINSSNVPNEARLNTISNQTQGMMWAGSDNSGYFTQCNTFNSQAVADMEISNGEIKNPHGSCGATTMPNNTFTTSAIKHINYPSGLNLKYYYGSSPTEPLYYTNVTKTSCGSSPDCSYSQNIMLADPDSVLQLYHNVNTCITSLSAVSSPTTDQVDSLSWLKWQHTQMQSIVVKNYMKNNKSDSAIYTLQSDTSFWSRYILTNVYTNLGQDTNAQNIIAAYSGYSGTDTNIIDFVLLQTFQLAAKNSGDVISYITAHDSALTAIANHNSFVAAQAKTLYNWYKVETDTGYVIPYPSEFDILPDTIVFTDTTQDMVDSTCISIALSPNPAITTISVTVSSSSNCGTQTLNQKVYRLYSSNVVDSKQFSLTTNTSHTSSVDLSGQPSGIYYITVDNGLDIMIAKLFIKE